METSADLCNIKAVLNCDMLFFSEGKEMGGRLCRDSPQPKIIPKGSEQVCPSWIAFEFIQQLKSISPPKRSFPGMIEQTTIRTLY
jgi:hypothetical protein